MEGNLIQNGLTINNDLGRKIVSFAISDDYKNVISLPAGVWNYGAIVSALVRTKYSESEVEAIVSNSLLLMTNPTVISEEEVTDKQEELQTFQQWRDKCKARAKELLELGKQMGLEEM